MQPSHTEQTMEDKILDWLNTQGYPLEMRVARAFQRQNFHVRQPVYYDDPDEKNSRESIPA